MYKFQLGIIITNGGKPVFFKCLGLYKNAEINVKYSKTRKINIIIFLLQISVILHEHNTEP